MEHRRSQSGVALVLVLILLGTGALIIGPSLRNTSTALNFFGISRENTDVAYALDAVTQQALWLMESDLAFADCGGTGNTFAECVGFHRSWDLATPDHLETKANESEIDTVNGQQVKVTVEVPAELGAPPLPTPTPTGAPCFSAWITRDPTWVQVNEPITYTLNVWNCSSSSSSKNLRHLIVITSGQMEYFGTSSGTLIIPPDEPHVGDCESPATTTQLALCPGYPTDSLLLSWPSADVPFGDTGGTQPQVKMEGGTPGDPARTLIFQLKPQSWGIFYIEVMFCHFSESNPCDAATSGTTGKVAPVVTGMFNINGKGKGNAFGASSKLDSGGADLISEQPQ